MKYLKTFEQIKMPTKELAPSSTTRVDKGRQPSIKTKDIFPSQYEMYDYIFTRHPKFNRIYVIKERPVSEKWVLNLNELLNSAIKHYTEWFSNSDTKKKLKNPIVINELMTLINTCRIFAIPPSIVQHKGAAAYVRDYLNDPVREFFDNIHPYTIFYNCEDLDGKFIKSALIHEIGHLIDFKLQQRGEKSIYDEEHKCKGIIKPSVFDNLWKSVTNDKGESQSSLNDDEKYIERPTEIYARLQQFRADLKLKPIENPESITKKFYDALKSKKFTFFKKISKAVMMKNGYLTDLETLKKACKRQKIKSEQFLTTLDNGTKLCFTPNGNLGPKYLPTTSVVDLVENINVWSNISNFSYGSLLVNFAEVKGGNLIVDMKALCQANNELVDTNKKDTTSNKLAPDPRVDTSKIEKPT